MLRVVALLLIALGLASCGPKPPTLEGKWAWFSPDNCEGDRDTIEFAGTDFFHRQGGEVSLQGGNVAYEVTEDGDTTLITAAYDAVVDDLTRPVSLTFEMQGDNTLVFRGSVVDGASPPTVNSALGRELFRCEGGHAVESEMSEGS
jgi:hypothetical protein